MTIYIDDPALSFEPDNRDLDMPLYVALFGLPALDKAVVVFAKDREPYGWIARGRVLLTDYDADGWEVRNVLTGGLEFVHPYEVLYLEVLPS